jgi:hypothetical protein
MLKHRQTLFRKKEKMRSRIFSPTIRETCELGTGILSEKQQ